MLRSALEASRWYPGPEAGPEAVRAGSSRRRSCARGV